MIDVDVTLGPGRYFLGDINIVLSKAQFQAWLNQDRPNGEVEFDDDKVAVCATDSGNGTFYDFEDRQYLVSNSNIGLVPESLWDVKESAMVSRGRILVVKEQVVFDVEDGIYYVTVDDDEPIEIDTESDEDYEYDDEEDGWPMDKDEQF